MKNKYNVTTTTTQSVHSRICIPWLFKPSYLINTLELAFFFIQQLMKESAKAPQKKHAYRRNQNGNFFMHLLIFSLASQLALVNCERMVFADFAVTGGTVLPANGYRYYL